MQMSSNDIKGPPSLRALRATTVLVGAAVLVRWLAGLVRATAAEAARGTVLPTASVLVAIAAGVAVLIVGWFALGIALETLARVPGAVGTAATAASRAVTPRLLRRAAGMLLGAGLGVGLGTAPAVAAAGATTARATAHAATTGSAPTPPDPRWAPDPDPRWVPEPPRVRPQPDIARVTAAPTRAPSAAEGHVVVRRGDSLWVIAARHLGPGATDREVAAEWPRWFAENRAVIGPDPDLIRPGQLLRAPGPEPAR